VKKTGLWRNDENVGDLVEYYPSGTVSSRSSFNSEGELEGALIAYHQNEIIKTIELYERGTKNGFTIQFDSTGTLLELSKYQDGLEITHTADSDELRGILDYVRDQNQLIFKRDSLRKQQTELELAEIESQAQIKQQQGDLKQEKIQRYYLYGGLLLLLIFGGMMYNRFKVTQRQKHIIEDQKREVDKQKELIEESHKEITDSIAYAKRIQSAILPPTSLFKESLKDSFVLYKPKDIVAGDFYWLEVKDNKVFFAAADCTGHGVPGAMVSVICNNALNRSVREFGCSDPGKILDQARSLVIQEFEKSEDEVKDGMDIALCSLDGKNLYFSGANNPLWIIRKGQLLEIKPDKQPIGKFQYAQAFTSHTITLEKGDTVYIFTDGYIDQFGGERGKKLKAKAFKDLLLNIQDKSMSEQKKHLDRAFETWRGKLEQIDDVCVIGVHV
jgi:serine phosphatase RsbU (regulator of sigma subunit)